MLMNDVIKKDTFFLFFDNKKNITFNLNNLRIIQTSFTKTTLIHTMNFIDQHLMDLIKSILKLLI